MDNDNLESAIISEVRSKDGEVQTTIMENNKPDYYLSPEISRLFSGLATMAGSFVPIYEVVNALPISEGYKGLFFGPLYIAFIAAGTVLGKAEPPCDE